jgi:uncharacterized protein (TIGR02246 family)
MAARRCGVDSLGAAVAMHPRYQQPPAPNPPAGLPLPTPSGTRRPRGQTADILPPMRAASPAALSAAFAAAMRAGDLEAAVALWHHDAAIVQSDGQLICGRDAITAALRTLIDNGVELTIELAAVYDGGGTALGTGTLTMSASNGHGGFEHSSEALVIYRRDESGGWRIALDAPWGLPQL